MKIPTPTAKLKSQPAEKIGSDSDRCASAVVECGIAFRLEFGPGHEDAALAVEELKANGIRCDEPESIHDQWTVRVSIDLLNCTNLEAQLVSIDGIAEHHGGRRIASGATEPSKEGIGLAVAGFANHCAGLAHRVENIAAWAAFDAGRFQESADRWRSLLRQGYLEPEGLIWIGKSEFELGKFQEARECFAEYLHVRANGLAAKNACLGLAWSMLRLQDLSGAEQRFLDLLGTCFAPLAMFGLACCRAADQEWSASLRWLKMAARRDPVLKKVARKERLFSPMKGVPQFERSLRVNLWDRIRMTWSETPETRRTRLLIR